MAKPAFEVDKKGLEKIIARRGKEFAVLELIQNALDEPGVTEVQVNLSPSEERRGLYMLTVRDDCPTGFADLSHAYTLFAESKKKSNPQQRGRFNLGEKLVLACCEEARIVTTTGAIRWEGNARITSRERTKVGSYFYGYMRMTRDEAARSEAAVMSVLVPENIKLTFNHVIVTTAPCLESFTVTLPTEVADDEGYLRPTKRSTTVSVHEIRNGESAKLYEMGIPVVECDGTWHINVHQKVPLNSDRDNVTPGYLRLVRAEVLNRMHLQLPAEDARQAWVNDALESNLLSGPAVNTVVTARYGDKRVIRDPSDPESTKLAMSQGYAIIEPGSFSSEQWDSIRSAKAALPSGQVTPSPKPFSENGRDLRVEMNPTDKMLLVCTYAKAITRQLIGLDIRVTLANDFRWPFVATFGGGELVFNIARLGKAWFEDPNWTAIHELLIHELGHHYSMDHLSSAYHDALCRLGSKLTDIALGSPDMMLAMRRATR